MQLKSVKSGKLIRLMHKFCFSKLVFLYFSKFKVWSSQLILEAIDNVLQCFTAFSKLYVESVITIDINLSIHKKENQKDRHLCFRKYLYFTYSRLHFCILDLIFFTSEKCDLLYVFPKTLYLLNIFALVLLMFINITLPGFHYF